MYSTALGYITTASGLTSTSMGYFTNAASLRETVVGSHNTIYTPISPISWNSADRLFVVGNGINNASKSDAIVVLKNGNTGFGISNPGERLDVSGNIKLSGAILNDAFTLPTLLNGWINNGAGHSLAGYYKDKEGRVHLRGIIYGGITTPGTPFFNLPAGYRPTTSGQLIYIAINGTGFARIDVRVNGDEIIMSGTSNYLSLDGISFRAD